MLSAPYTHIFANILSVYPRYSPNSSGYTVLANRFQWVYAVYPRIPSTTPLVFTSIEAGLMKIIVSVNRSWIDENNSLLK